MQARLHQVEAAFGIQPLACAALLLFLLVFLGALAWIFRKDSPGLYESLSHLPLNAEPNYSGEERLNQ